MQRTRKLVRGLTLASMLPWLLACQSSPQPIKTQIVEVPVEVQVPIPSKLTDKPPRPKRPPNRCKDAQGRPTICNRDTADWLLAYDALVTKLYGQLDAILGLQPEVP